MNLRKIVNNHFLFTLISLILIVNIFTFTKVIAQEGPPQGILPVLNTAGDIAGYNVPESDVSGMLDTTIGLIIAVVLGFLGVIFFVIIIYSGYQWMTAGGNEETVTKAKKRLTNATIGLIIVISGFVISYFVVTQLSNITTEPGGPGSGS